MPTYEYKCLNCGHKFEMFQSMTAAPLSDCPSCNRASTLKRLIGRGSGIIFKGSGFYQTDYKSTSTPPSIKSDTGSAPAASSDTKPSLEPAQTKTPPEKKD